MTGKDADDHCQCTYQAVHGLGDMRIAFFQPHQNNKGSYPTKPELRGHIYCTNIELPLPSYMPFFFFFPLKNGHCAQVHVQKIYQINF